MPTKLRQFAKICREEGLAPAIAETIQYVLFFLITPKFLKAPKYRASQETRLLEKIDPKPLIGSEKFKTITWIMPDFIKGAGGHKTIFRFAKYFELLGYKNIFLICDYGNQSKTKKLPKIDFVEKKIYQYFFTPLNSQVRYYNSGVALLEQIDEIDTDFVIGTDMRSQLIAMNVTKANRRLSFLQDDEPRFQAAGSISALVNAHYCREDNEIICAGKWLASLLDVNHKFIFDLGVDSLKSLVFRQIFTGTRQQHSRIKIAVYSRSTTERRCVDLAWSYLNRLHQIGEQFEVHTFGGDRRDWDFQFPSFHHGVLSPTALYRLLLECDICIALSATNYSLLPNEAASVGTIAVDLDTPSNRMVYDTNRVKLIGPEVPKAANQLQEIIKQCHNNMNSTGEMDLSLAYEQDLSWETQKKSISQAIFGEHKSKPINVSVCIPTRNAGPEFELLLFSLKKQSLVELELCIIDTESDDQTLELAYRYFPDARVHKITKAEFGHGKTRNQLAQMATKEYIIFLTQDAIPLDELLVVSLAMHVSKNPRICGSFCAHVANPSHSRFIAHSLEKHFEVMAGRFSPSNFAKDENDSLKFRFFSTNCALLKRSLLLANPFEDVAYGEDQIWAFQMLNKGFGTAFVPDVSILHSHAYDGDELVAMTRTDLEFHKIHFGEFPNWSQKLLDRMTDKIAAKIGASKDELEHEKARNVLKMEGYRLAKNSDRVTYAK